MTTTSQGPVLLVGLGSQGRAYLTAARRLGLDVLVVDRAPSLASPKTRRILDDSVTVIPVRDVALPTDWYLAARDACEARPPIGVVAFSEDHVVPAALIATERGLPGPGLHAALVSRDKSLQRSLFQVAGICQPRWVHTSETEEALAWLADHDRAVAKPVDRGGSSGVRLVTSAAELVAWHEAEQPGTFLLEEFVQGPEFSVELLVREGTVLFANVTAKATTRPPVFVETGHTAPADISVDLWSTLVSAGTDVVGALGMATGIAHVELRASHQGPAVMEVAVRTPGDHIMETVGAAWGTDMFENVVRLACGLPIRTSTRPRRVAEVRFPDAAQIQAGRLAELEVGDRAGVLMSSVTSASAGSTWHDSSSRGGAFIVHDDDHPRLEARMAALLRGEFSTVGPGGGVA
ncbi:ATP-grasp domain-containing protein [Cellulosimicrobium cellulans]|uniref:ATP-grasp domain-containing protein n=1 Tax=Cellulosimicrobium cellulans TaxID=1710 RepID=UPI00382ED377